MAKLRKRNLSHGRLTTVQFGELTPVSVVEVLPGDVFRQRHRVFLRVSTLARPVMHQVRMRLHTFFVPNRLLWDEWEDFAVGVPDNAQQTRTVPTVTPDGGSLCDHMGVPPGLTDDVVAFPFYAYRLIWNEWFRDQNLQSELVIDDGSVDMLNACWERDYFTSCRPQPQLGLDITIPLAGGGAPVLGIGYDPTGAAWDATSRNVRETGATGTTSWASTLATSSAPGIRVEEDPNNAGFPNVRLSDAAGIDVDELRRGLALQRIAEARMRYGSRYNEMLRHWGVNPRDGRLQIPELIATGQGMIAFSEVLDTAAASAGSFVGDQAGHGIAAVQTRPYRKMFEEHGWCITLMSVMPRTSYVQSVPRWTLRKDRDDYFHPELAGIGDQAVFERELYGVNGNEDTVFGWQERYREYKDLPSTVHGAFRSGEDLNWHMARSFSSAPVLNASFVESVPTNRILADTTQAHMRVNIANDIQARRLV